MTTVKPLAVVILILPPLEEISRPLLRLLPLFQRLAFPWLAISSPAFPKIPISAACLTANKLHATGKLNQSSGSRHVYAQLTVSCSCETSGTTSTYNTALDDYASECAYWAATGNFDTVYPGKNCTNLISNFPS